MYESSKKSRDCNLPGVSCVRKGIVVFYSMEYEYSVGGQHG